MASLLLVLPFVVLGMFVWAGILFKWRLGIYALVIYTPFTGLVVAAFAPSPIGNLIRDFLIIIPLYIAFFLARRQSDRMVMLPGFMAIMGCLAILIAGSSALSTTAGTVVALLGAKIWLFYIPLVFISSAFVRDKSDLLILMRTFVVMGWIPCGVGLLMWFGAINYDYKESIELVYGDFARNATQNFAAFQVGQSKIYRIPGTFQFAAQYSMFCLFMIFPTLIQARLDHVRNWRLFGFISLGLFVAAALTSGSRGAFLHVPFLLALFGALRFGFGRGSNLLVVFAFMVFGFMLLSQFDESAIIDHVAELAAANGQVVVLGGLSYAIEQGGLWGQGVGVGTVSARHVVTDMHTNIAFAAIENYYAKAWMELGIFGFVAIVFLFIYLVVVGLQSANRIVDNNLRDAALVLVALVIFIAYLSARGWPLDQDPLAYYFWVMVGILVKLGKLETRAANPASDRAGFRGSQVRPSLAGQ